MIIDYSLLRFYLKNDLICNNKISKIIMRQHDVFVLNFVLSFTIKTYSSLFKLIFKRILVNYF